MNHNNESLQWTLERKEVWTKGLSVWLTVPHCSFHDKVYHFPHVFPLKLDFIWGGVAGVEGGYEETIRRMGSRCMIRKTRWINKNKVKKNSRFINELFETSYISVTIPLSSSCPFGIPLLNHSLSYFLVFFSECVHDPLSLEFLAWAWVGDYLLGRARTTYLWLHYWRKWQSIGQQLFTANTSLGSGGVSWTSSYPR